MKSSSAHVGSRCIAVKGEGVGKNSYARHSPSDYETLSPTFQQAIAIHACPMGASMPTHSLDANLRRCHIPERRQLENASVLLSRIESKFCRSSKYKLQT